MIMVWLKRLGAACTALAAIGVVLAYCSTFLAWSSDIHKLSRDQSETAIEMYNQKVRGYLAHPAPADPVNRQVWDEDLRQARDKLDRAEKRKIELSR